MRPGVCSPPRPQSIRHWFVFLVMLLAAALAHDARIHHCAVRFQFVAAPTHLPSVNDARGSSAWQFAYGRRERSDVYIRDTFPRSPVAGNSARCRKSNCIRCARAGSSTLQTERRGTKASRSAVAAAPITLSDKYAPLIHNGRGRGSGMNMHEHSLFLGSEHRSPSDLNSARGWKHNSPARRE